MRSRFHHVNVAVAELEKHGASDIEIEPRNGHPSIWFSWNGERRFIRVAGSPSSQNSWRKIPTKVRRALGVGPYSSPAPMSDETISIPARVAGDGSIRFGGNYVTIQQHLRVEGETLIVVEVRQYDDLTRQAVETGRFHLQPIHPR